MSTQWDEDEVEPVRVIRSRDVVDLDTLDDGRCTASSWGPAKHLPDKPTYENHFGPGGFNRCIGSPDHANQYHRDEWGHVFAFTKDGRYRTVRVEKPEPVRLP